LSVGNVELIRCSTCFRGLRDLTGVHTWEVFQGLIDNTFTDLRLQRLPECLNTCGSQCIIQISPQLQQPPIKSLFLLRVPLPPFGEILQRINRITYPGHATILYNVATHPSYYAVKSIQQFRFIVVGEGSKGSYDYGNWFVFLVTLKHNIPVAFEQLHGLLRNFPNRFVAGVLRLLIFPRGRTYHAPADKLGQQIVKLLTRPTEARERLTANIYKGDDPRNMPRRLQKVLEQVEANALLSRKLQDAVRSKLISAEDEVAAIHEAREAGILTEDEATSLLAQDAAVMEMIRVDDFAPETLRCG